MHITLTESEVRICTWLAKQRFAANRAASICDRQMGKQSSEQTDLDGISGEFAFCKAINSYPDMSITPRRGGSDVVVNGHGIDIKTTRCLSGHLLATVGKELSSSDVYVLVIGTIPKFRIAGWATATQLLHRDNIKDFGHGRTYALPQHRLHPFVCGAFLLHLKTSMAASLP